MVWMMSVEMQGKQKDLKNHSFLKIGYTEQLIVSLGTFYCTAAMWFVPGTDPRHGLPAVPASLSGSVPTSQG
jgi:hypothetical protein